jgi:hypothetical protein
MYFKKAEWGLPKKKIKQFIRLRRVNKYTKLRLKSDRLSKQKKLQYILGSIKQFLTTKSLENGLVPSNGVKLFRNFGKTK